MTNPNRGYVKITDDKDGNPLPVDQIFWTPAPFKRMPLGGIHPFRPIHCAANLVHFQPPQPPGERNHEMDERELLQEFLDGWVEDYNHTLVTAAHHVLPTCWSQHPALLPAVAVVATAWWEAHRLPGATAGQAWEWRMRVLEPFQDRIRTLMGGLATKCLEGQHYTGAQLDHESAAAVGALGISFNAQVEFAALRDATTREYGTEPL